MKGKLLASLALIGVGTAGSMLAATEEKTAASALGFAVALLGVLGFSKNK